ncbi:Coenzyme A disulfide reductase [Candidatus Lokiarchaeum ossiferum]|uniref:Coenzyme A disulfide reductase n=1 Tax=Candidatus Lokiarchaeum ossiferum TaxID=2951803 RepID=A0ABY6HKP4_9ARCH|nr:Coenzyme A disulfide reductase [Candidatus Lokiarchaeum sp. B-35]
MKTIIIGGNPAGLSAASAIRKKHKDWEIDVYEKGQYISYGACGIPYFVADDVKNLDNLMTLTKEGLMEKRNIPVHIYHEVVSVDFNRKTVKIKAIQNNREFEEKYDYLVITTGGQSSTEKIQIPNNILTHSRLFKVHTLSQAAKLKTFLQSTKVENVVIIGSGYIGLEMLEAYEALNVKKITLIGPRLNFRTKSQDFIQKELEKHNIQLILQNRVQTLNQISDTSLEVLLQDGTKLQADAVQLSIGVIPATQMFKNTELKTLPNGAILVDEFCRTNIEKVYSAGDCATSYHNLLKKDVYLPLAPTANKQGRIAGSHIAGIPTSPFPGIIGTSVFKVFDLYCAQTGIQEDIAKELSYNATSIMITNNEIAHYYPNAKKMSIQLCFDIDTHLVLGAEITAPSSLGAKKIDVFATAIAAHMKIDDLQQLDLSYAPPFAPVWDPILIAANIARKKCK